MAAAMPILRVLAVGLLALTVGLGAAAAKDKAPAQRKVGIAISGDQILASFSYRDAFTAEIKEKLRSGLPTRIVIQISLEKKKKSKPVSYWARSISIIYDLWEEVYIITVEDNKGRRRAKVSTVPEVVELAGVISRGQVAMVGELPSGSYRLHTLIEVNPVSKEMIDNIRRWLAKKPEGSSTGSANFFGSFVGIFVDRQIGKADYSSVFVSQAFPIGAP